MRTPFLRRIIASLVVPAIVLAPALGSNMAAANHLPSPCKAPQTSPWFQTPLVYTVAGFADPARGSYAAQYRYHQEYATYSNGGCSDVLTYCEVRVWDSPAITTPNADPTPIGPWSHFALGWYADFYDDDPLVTPAVWIADGHYKTTPLMWPPGASYVWISKCGLFGVCGLDVRFTLVDGRVVEAEGDECDPVSALGVATPGLSVVKTRPPNGPSLTSVRS